MCTRFCRVRCSDQVGNWHPHRKKLIKQLNRQRVQNERLTVKLCPGIIFRIGKEASDRIGSERRGEGGEETSRKKEMSIQL
jgi:hypothetical protein